MPKIFIAYHQSDSAIVGHIEERLISRFGKAAVIAGLHWDDFWTGAEVRQQVWDVISQANILLAVIGPNSLDQRTTFFGLKLEVALEVGTAILPVLVGGATMPSTLNLPDTLKDLSRLQAIQIDAGTDFSPHMDRLIRAIEHLADPSTKNVVQSTDSYDVFIAYSGLENIAMAACAALEREDLRCWIAPRDIAPFADWTKAVLAAMDHSRLLLVLASKWTDKSPQIRAELDYASKKGIPHVSLRIDDIPSKMESTDEINALLEDRLEQVIYRIKLRFPRNSPEYWLHRVHFERNLTPGDQPLVLISFASDDQKWVVDLRDYLDAKMEILTDKERQPYHLWNYSDAKHGTRVGDEFPEIVAEKMWRCQAAILLFSRSYFRSDYCKQIELPFLLWRRDHHKLMCLPIKIGTPSYEKVRIPNYQSDSRYVVLNELVDDRQAAEKFTESQYRSWDLGRLKQEGKEWDIEQRLAGVAHHIAEFLKANCSAVEVG